MRRSSGLMAGLAVIAVTGCGGAGHPAAEHASHPSTGPVQGATAAGVLAATAHFEELYFAGQSGSSWVLLTSGAKREISESVWAGVHEGCWSASARVTRVIKSVTLFGNAAIITEAVSGARHGTDEYIFNYSGGSWRYSPADLSIYRHGSVSADIASARAAGLCGGWKVF